MLCTSQRECGKKRRGIPFRLVLSEDLAFRVVANHLDIDEAAEIESFRSEHRHLCCGRGASWASSNG